LDLENSFEPLNDPRSRSINDCQVLTGVCDPVRASLTGLSLFFDPSFRFSSSVLILPQRGVMTRFIHFLLISGSTVRVRQEALLVSRLSGRSESQPFIFSYAIRLEQFAPVWWLLWPNDSFLLPMHSSEQR